MYLTKEECNGMLQRFVQESIGLFNEYNELSKVYNLNDFNPNEIKMETIKITLEKLTKTIESLQIYMAHAFHTKS
jgi:hypothetical protein